MGVLRVLVMCEWIAAGPWLVTMASLWFVRSAGLWLDTGQVEQFLSIVGAVFAALTGVVVGIPSLRLKGDYLAIVTLGFGEILRILFTNATFLGSATGYFGDDPAGLPGYTSFFWVFLWVVIIIVAIRNITFSQTGRSLIAIREDEIGAEMRGINTTAHKITAFIIAAFSSGIAGR